MLIDALSDILYSLRFRGSTYFYKHFYAPWGIEEPAAAGGMFHIVTDGSAWLLHGEMAAPVSLTAGDIVLFPAGMSHKLYSSENAELLNGSEVIEAVAAGRPPFQEGSGEGINLICGYMHYNTQGNHPFLNSLPGCIRMNQQQVPGLSHIAYLIDCLKQEMDTQTPGTTAMVDRLTEILIIQIIREHIRLNSEKQPFFRALRDEKIGRLLSSIHQRPGDNWSVETMGAQAHMSRSSFSARFNELVGVPPMKYLTEWRMRLAGDLLSDSKLSISAIAAKVGYGSEAAFAKAFKQFYHLPPGEARRQSQAEHV